MAKLSFKDMIFKFLKKDENLGAYGGVKQNPSKRFKVKFAMPNKPNNMAVAAYQFEKDAEKFKKDVIAKGGKAILTKEDAPANATGTAVAGTGDDSSTVVVKKKKELQKKLMTRMGIKEAIDKAIPDLEYPKDEIRERANELKKLASKSKDQRAPIYKQQAKNIAKAAKIPHNFNKKEGAAVPKDKKAKTKPSKHTNKFKQMYGEDYLNEKIKGLETKAKKSGMPYSILKKVYDRGMAAWKGGHRPGTTPQQWAFARVNSFTTKSSGTWGKADKDLAKQVRGS
jgi:hypothetical protein